GYPALNGTPNHGYSGEKEPQTTNVGTPNHEYGEIACFQSVGTTRNLKPRIGGTPNHECLVISVFSGGRMIRNLKQRIPASTDRDKREPQTTNSGLSESE